MKATAPIPLWLKLGWTAWVGVWIPFYWWWHGPQNFLWFCDLANFMVAIALWRESRLLFSWQALSVLFVQLLWTIDLVGRILVGTHLIGGSEYMFESSTPLVIRLLSLFHGVMPFVLIWAIYRLGYEPRSLWFQLGTIWLVLPVSFLFFGPERNINWVWGPFDKPQHAVSPEVYFAACMIGYPLVLSWPTHLAITLIEKARSRWKSADDRTDSMSPHSRASH
jgi:hypothetical protein